MSINLHIFSKLIIYFCSDLPKLKVFHTNIFLTNEINYLA
jgi:hypothetical protein